MSKMKKIIVLPVIAVLLACIVLAGAAEIGGAPAETNEESQGTFWDRNKIKLDLPDPSKYEGMTDKERVDAMKADLKASLDQKVADGEITREQADRMLQRFSNKLDSGGTRFRDGKELLPQLGLDPSKYAGMTDQERNAAMQADLKAALDQKVADGEIAREQADKILNVLTNGPPHGPETRGGGRDCRRDGADSGPADGAQSNMTGQATAI